MPRGTQEPTAEACALSPTRLSLSLACLSMQLRLEHRFLTSGAPCRTPVIGPTTPDGQRRQPVTSIQFGLVPVRSPLLGESRLISFPPATEMFHFAGLPATRYVFTRSSRSFITWWLPHSEISGSTLARSSPKLIAACHVLHRRLPPRHPPRALTHFNPDLQPHQPRPSRTKQDRPRRRSQVRGENLKVPTTELLPFPMTSSDFKEPDQTNKAWSLATE